MSKLKDKNGEHKARTNMTEARISNPQGSYVDTVLGYGLSQGVAKMVEKACKAVGADFFRTAVLTDILAVPCFFMVCDFSALGKEQLKLQYSNMSDVADGDFAWLLLGTQAIKPTRRLLSAAVRFPEPLDEQYLKVILLRHRTAVRRRIERTRTYDRKLFRGVTPFQWTVRDLCLG